MNMSSIDRSLGVQNTSRFPYLDNLPSGSPLSPVTARQLTPEQTNEYSLGQRVAIRGRDVGDPEQEYDFGDIVGYKGSGRARRYFVQFSDEQVKIFTANNLMECNDTSDEDSMSPYAGLHAGPSNNIHNHKRARYGEYEPEPTPQGVPGPILMQPLPMLIQPPTDIYSEEHTLRSLKTLDVYQERKHQVPRSSVFQRVCCMCQSKTSYFCPGCSIHENGKTKNYCSLEKKNCFLERHIISLR